MAKVWIVYRPILDYEESIQNYLAFRTEDAAKAAAQRMNEFHAALRERLDALPDCFEHDISDDEHAKRWERREKIIEKAKWPFGVSLRYDLGHSGTVVEVMSIPLLEVA